MPSLLRTDLESQDKTGPVSTVLFIHIVLDDMNNFSGDFGNNIATWDVKNVSICLVWYYFRQLTTLACFCFFDLGKMQLLLPVLST